jgi:hypothetical protein
MPVEGSGSRGELGELLAAFLEPLRDAGAFAAPP